MLSLATRLPKRLVIPRNSSCSAASLANMARPGAVRYITAPGRALVTPGSRLHPALGGGLDHAALDARLHLRELLFQRRGDLAVPLVERCKRHAAVLEGADVVAALEGAALGSVDSCLHRRLDALFHARDEVRAVLGGADAAVGVDPLHV